MTHQIDQPVASSFEIGSVTPGTISRFNIHLFNEDTFGPVQVPAVVVRGARAGRTLFAVAGVHGNEYEGMEAIRSVLPSLDPARMVGTFAAIFIANPFAFANRSRETPSHLDGLNLARVFPGNSNGSPTRKLAAALFDLVRRNLRGNDLFLDFHSGTAEVAFVTMVGFRDSEGPARQASEEAARHMGSPRLWAIPDLPGPFNAEIARIGIPSIGTETTGRAGCLADDVGAYTTGLRNLLAYLEICPDQPKPSRDNRPAHTTIDILSPVSGFLRNDRNLNDEVSAGDRLGILIDPFGDQIAEIISPSSGAIWAARATPEIKEGELAFMVATNEQ